MSDKNAHGKSVEDLLREVDAALPMEEIGKRARLSDLNATIAGTQGDIVALRRMLMQHRDPQTVIHESGAKLGETLREKLAQYKRLRAYREELEALPDDPETKDEEGETHDD